MSVLFVLFLSITLLVVVGFIVVTGINEFRHRKPTMSKRPCRVRIIKVKGHTKKFGRRSLI